MLSLKHQSYSQQVSRLDHIPKANHGSYLQVDFKDTLFFLFRALIDYRQFELIWYKGAMNDIGIMAVCL